MHLSWPMTIVYLDGENNEKCFSNSLNFVEVRLRPGGGVWSSSCEGLQKEWGGPLPTVPWRRHRFIIFVIACSRRFLLRQGEESFGRAKVYPRRQRGRSLARWLFPPKAGGGLTVISVIAIDSRAATSFSSSSAHKSTTRRS